MKKHRIKIKITFEGTIDVIADNKIDAIHIIDRGFNTPVLQVNHKHTWESTGSIKERGVIDYAFDIHPVDIKYK